MQWQTHGEEVHAVRQEMLHLRQALESTFRKTLKDLEGTYRRKVQHIHHAKKMAVLVKQRIWYWQRCDGYRTKIVFDTMPTHEKLDRYGADA